MPILPCSATSLEPNNWQAEYAQAFTNINDLLNFLNLDPDRLDYSQNNFPLRVSRHFAGLMTPGDYDDPLLKQILPTAAEHIVDPSFVTDPTGDNASGLGEGLLKKYTGRALLIATGACAINCRYCFRRHFPYQQHNAARHQWFETLQKITAMEDISEIILSGGDPLVLDNDKLQSLIKGLDNIPHIKRLRIHSRLPVVLPRRIDEGLVRILRNSRLRTVMVIHANHPNELSPELQQALRPLLANGVSILNQSVLLKDINDNAATLAELSERLFASGIMPYYLHLLDKVQGAAHFAVSIKEGQNLIEKLQTLLPGYLVPKFVREMPGASSKTPISCKKT